MNRGKRPVKKIIHVNQHVIKSNRVNNENEPPLTVKIRGKAHYAHEVVIHGPSLVVNRPHKPLSCGARVWIETYAEVELIYSGEASLLAEEGEGCESHYH